MSTADLKIDLINKIMKLKEVHIIKEIQKIIDFELDNSEYQLTAAQRSRIDEAKADQVISEEQANNEIETWLNEK